MTGVDAVTLSRLQFSLTAMFHILWPTLTVGLSIFLLVLEALWLRTGDKAYYHHARFWGRLFLLNVAVGVATGIPLEFQFGTNWGPFSVAGGDFFGHMLGFEAAMAFMLEAAFIGIMAFGWDRVSRAGHLLATAMVALGASLSAFWILVANSWMHTPTGGHFEDGRFVLTSHVDAIFNPDMHWGVAHMWVASLETTAFVVGGLSAWYLRRGRHPEFFLRSLKLAFAAALVIAPLQVLLGDGSGRTVFEHQPAKLAGIEAHWVTNAPGTGAPWSLVAWPDPQRERNAWALEIPSGLSLLLTHSATGRVQGLRDIPAADRPPIVVPYYCFRVMTGIGFAFAALALWTAWAWHRGGLRPDRVGAHPWLLRGWMAAGPLGYVAVETGWMTREIGRQPWVIYGLLRTTDAASPVAAGAVGASILGFAAAYAALLAAFVFFARRMVAAGPRFEEPPAPRARGRE
ncbi:MAG TPA: cytochrome ubiquinol oxidase subunit I [bacterium]